MADYLPRPIDNVYRMMRSQMDSYGQPTFAQRYQAATDIAHQLGAAASGLNRGVAALPALNVRYGNIGALAGRAASYLPRFTPFDNGPSAVGPQWQRGNRSAHFVAQNSSVRTNLEHDNKRPDDNARLGSDGNRAPSDYSGTRQGAAFRRGNVTTAGLGRDAGDDLAQTAGDVARAGRAIGRRLGGMVGQMPSYAPSALLGRAGGALGDVINRVSPTTPERMGGFRNFMSTMGSMLPYTNPATALADVAMRSPAIASNLANVARAPSFGNVGQAISGVAGAIPAALTGNRAGLAMQMPGIGARIAQMMQNPTTGNVGQAATDAASVLPALAGIRRLGGVAARGVPQAPLAPPPGIGSRVRMWDELARGMAEDRAAGRPGMYPGVRGMPPALPPIARPARPPIMPPAGAPIPGVQPPMPRPIVPSGPTPLGPPPGMVPPLPTPRLGPISGRPNFNFTRLDDGSLLNAHPNLKTPMVHGPSGKFSGKATDDQLKLLNRRPPDLLNPPGGGRSLAGSLPPAGGPNAVRSAPVTSTAEAGPAATADVGQRTSRGFGARDQGQPSGAYGGGDPRGSGRIWGLKDSDIRGIFQPRGADRTHYGNIGVTPLPFAELNPATGGKIFHAAIGRAKAANKFAGPAVQQYSPEEYAQMRTFLTPKHDAGFALKGDDIVSVFEHKDAPHLRASRAALDLATKLGGRRLDAFDTVLPSLYAKAGFRAVARVPFNREFAPPDWNYGKMAGFNKGEPDVVFMVHDPIGARAYDRSHGVQARDYDHAVEIQKAEVARLARQGKGFPSQLAPRLIPTASGHPYPYGGSRLPPVGLPFIPAAAYQAEIAKQRQRLGLRQPAPYLGPQPREVVPPVPPAPVAAIRPGKVTTLRIPRRKP